MHLRTKTKTIVFSFFIAFYPISLCAQIPTPTPVNLVCHLELEYSTYLGGSANDGNNGIALDSDNCAYVTGFANSSNFPTFNPYQASVADIDGDSFVAKLSSSGSSLIYSTYLGGNLNDISWAICVDSDHNAYVAGETYSIDFPTQNPYQASLASTIDGFVAKLASSGSLLIYSTYLGGGSGNSGGAGIAVDSAYCVYISGYSESSGFPLQNPYQSSLAGYSDVIITKFSSTGSSLIYSTYLGGILPDIGWDIAVSSDFCAYVVGEVGSVNFPTYNSYQPSIDGGSDVFLTKLSSSGSSLIYSTYLGGSSSDEGKGVSVDPTDNAYVTGSTSSLNFPTFNAYQASRGGGNVFLAKFSTSGSSLIYSTYLGGMDSDQGYDIFVDTADCAYITGWASSPDFPTKNPYQSSLAGLYDYLDAFVTKFSSSGSSVIYSTFFGGGNNYDIGWGIAVDSEGCVYVSGSASSDDFPTVNPYQSSRAGSGDVFVAKLRLVCYLTTPLPTSTPTPSPTTSPSPTPTASLTPTPEASPTSSPSPTPSLTPYIPTATPSPTPSLTPTAIPTPQSLIPIIDSGDYNGDGTSDIAIFRPFSGLWAVRDLGRVYFGTQGDYPVSGDYDGDGYTDVAIFRPATNLWAIKEITRLYYGTLNNIPVPGDYNGDGTCDIGVFDNSLGLWSLREITMVYYGSSGDQPVPGDYDGDGSEDIALFRGSSGLWALRNISRVYFGTSGDIPVPAIYQWYGTGLAAEINNEQSTTNNYWSPFRNQIAIFRPSTGLWAIRGYTRFYYGTFEDIPVPADFNGNSLNEIGIFRPSSGLWAAQGITRIYYGAEGDIPVTR